MFRLTQFLTKIDNSDGSVIYLLEKSEKVLLPININGDKNNVEVPSIYNTLYRILKPLDMHIESIKIYLHMEKIFYAYLVIKSPNSVYEINIGVEDAINIAFDQNLQILVEEDILDTEGFKVTKELIEQSLSVNT